MINPYAGIDWSSVQRIPSVSHQHLSHTGSKTQSSFNSLYENGVRHYALSRYRPSIPTYPFDYEEHTFDYVANPFDSTLPLDQLIEKYSVPITFPDGCYGSPNAEHVYSQLYVKGAWYKWMNVHINGLGSFFESGTVPSPTQGYNAAIGVNAPYTACIDGILANLQYEDGGGVIINHPTWTEQHAYRPIDIERFLKDCLDYDPRVLGFDVIEGGGQGRMMGDLAHLDNILLTGRRCWAFGIGDWDTTRGHNVMLVPAQSSPAEYEHAILQAYRQGRWYVQYADTDLRFVNISYDAEAGLADFDVIGADGIILTIDGVSRDYPNPNPGEYLGVSATVAGKTYVRAMAYINRDDDPNWEYKATDIYKDVAISQPIVFNPQTYPYDPLYDHIEATKKNARPLWLWG